MTLSFRTRSFLAVLLAMLAAACARPIVASAGPPVDVVAKNWTFSPSTIQAKVGETTVLHLTSSEGVHGVESAEIGLAKTTILPGKGTDVSFTPKTAGTFVVHCAVMCGEGHDKMTFTVTVAP